MEVRRSTSAHPVRFIWFGGLVPKTTISLSEAATVSLICFGLFILWSVQAIAAGFPDAEFSESSNGWMIGLELILASAALLYLRSRNFDIGSLYPAPTIRGSIIGTLLFLAAWMVGILATSAVQTPGTQQVVNFSFSGASLASVVAFAIVNGAFEEVFLLGVLMRGLRQHGLSAAIGASLLVRLLYHVYQGPLGLIWVLAIGATLTLAYVVTRQLWPSVLAHTLWDIVPVFLH